MELFQKRQLTPICPPQVKGCLVDLHPSTFQAPWLDHPLLTLHRLSPRPHSALCLSPCPSPCCLPRLHSRISNRACWPSKSWACGEPPPPPPRTPWVRCCCCCCGLSLDLSLGYTSSHSFCHFSRLERRRKQHLGLCKRQLLPESISGFQQPVVCRQQRRPVSPFQRLRRGQEEAQTVGGGVAPGQAGQCCKELF